MTRFQSFKPTSNFGKYQNTCFQPTILSFGDSHKYFPEKDFVFLECFNKIVEKKRRAKVKQLTEHAQFSENAIH